MVLVHIRDAERGHEFLEEMWPGAAAIADPDRALYREFGLGRGTLREMFAPDVWRAGLRAIGKGASLGLPDGDVFTMPGMFLVHGESVLWSHAYRHAGDQPDLDDMRAALPRAGR